MEYVQSPKGKTDVGEFLSSSDGFFNLGVGSENFASEVEHRVHIGRGCVHILEVVTVFEGDNIILVLFKCYGAKVELGKKPCGSPQFLVQIDLSEAGECRRPQYRVQAGLFLSNALKCKSSFINILVLKL